jgi:hypothetical protein
MAAENTNIELHSTAAILVSLQSHKMPHLSKLIIPELANTNTSSILSLGTITPQQLNLARQHPNNIVNEALVAFAETQISLNTTQAQQDNIVENRSKITNIAKILSTKTDRKQTLEQLEQPLQNINDAATKLNKILTKIDTEQFDAIDKKVASCIKQWLEHNIIQTKNLNAELKEHNLEFTTETEKALTSEKSLVELPDTTKLQNIGIKIGNSSALKTQLYGAIADNMTAHLQTLNEKTFKSLVNSLETFDKLDDAEKILHKQQTKDFNSLITTAKDLGLAAKTASLDENSIRRVASISNQVASVPTLEE